MCQCWLIAPNVISTALEGRLFHRASLASRLADHPGTHRPWLLASPVSQCCRPVHPKPGAQKTAVQLDGALGVIGARQLLAQAGKGAAIQYHGEGLLLEGVDRPVSGRQALSPHADRGWGGQALDRWRQLALGERAPDGGAVGRDRADRQRRRRGQDGGLPIDLRQRLRRSRPRRGRRSCGSPIARPSSKTPAHGLGRRPITCSRRDRLEAPNPRAGRAPHRILVAARRGSSACDRANVYRPSRRRVRGLTTSYYCDLSSYSPIERR